MTQVTTAESETGDGLFTEGDLHLFFGSMPHYRLPTPVNSFDVGPQTIDELTEKDALNETTNFKANQGEHVSIVPQEKMISVPEICFSDSTSTSGFSSLMMDSTLEANGFMPREVTSVFGLCICNPCFSGDPV